MRSDDQTRAVDPTVLIAAIRAPMALLDLDGVVLAANRRFCDTLGVGVPGLVGHRLDDGDSHWLEGLIERVSRDGVVASGHVPRASPPESRARSLHVAASPVRTTSDATAVLLELEEVADSSVRDREQAMLAALVEGASDMVVRVDLGGVVQWANAATFARLGYSAAELIGQPFSLVLPARARKEATCLEGALHEAQAEPLLSWRRASDGREIPVSVSIFPIAVREEVVGIATVARDTSERIAAQHALARANRALRRKAADLESFTYTVSHDLKSPLVTVTGFLGMAESHIHEGKTDAALESIERVRAAAERMGSMLEELLRFSRLGRRPLEKRRIDTGPVVQQLATAFQPRLRERGCALEVADRLPVVSADRELLLRALENLLANAVEHGCGQSGGSVRVSGGADHGATWLAVEDDGAGIDAEDQARVLRLFERGSTAAGGVGMGLSIVQRILGLHDGDLKIESAGVGRGSRFVIRFPESEEGE